MVEYCQEQPLFLAEGTVNAAAVDAGRFHEVLNGCCLVPPFPEQRHRAIENFATVKLFYARHFVRSCWNYCRSRPARSLRKQYTNFHVDRQHLRIFHPLSLTARSKMI